MQSASLANLSGQQLRRAAQIKERIEALQRELSQALGVPNGAVQASGGRRVLSPAARAKIAAAQRARWAKYRGSVVAKPAKRKGVISADGRARIVAAQKARWAKAKAQAK